MNSEHNHQWKSPRRAATVLTALLLGVGGSALSAPQSFSYRGTPLLTGGGNETERRAIREEAAPYNLWLAFVEKDTGKYVSGVKVSVVDANGEPVVDAVTDGPWLLAQLPPGRYVVRMGDGQEEPVTVAANAQTMSVLQVPRQPG